MKRFLVSLFILVGASVTAAVPLHAQAAKSGSADILVKSTASWNGKPYTPYANGTPELTVLKLTIAPKTALPWHRHPYPNAGYVLEGSLTIQDKESGVHKTFHAGEAFTESVDDAHRGVAGDEKTVVLLVYAGIKGQPTSVPLPGQQKEY
ncbi:MAG: cupin domain-containing protein [Acetobacter aceti]|uniref:Cupin n=1 Tax=Acetobacter aceti TaxID=435 RepID=A0A1U9KL72_ACEAC|nr:cupin domain-containing protein [Acetobacter aceti]AQS86507.1 cupin [Acetobacter aceti]